MPDPAIAMSTESEEQGFADAVAAFAKDEAPVPEPVLAPPQVPPTPTPEPEPEQKAASEETPAEEAINKDTEKPAQEEGKSPALIALEKELDTLRRETRKERQRADYWMQNYQQRAVTEPATKQPEAATPQHPFNEAKPKLADFETADQWGDALTEWTIRKADAQLEQHTQRWLEQESQKRTVDYINARIVEGQKQFGTHEFNQASQEVIEFAPAGSTMYNLLIGLDKFPGVVTHLAKNLAETERISNLRYEDQVYELKALEKRLISKEVLATKSQNNNHKQATKVEAPGAGEEPGKPAVSITKLRNAAKASGNTKDWAAVFQADPTM